MGVSQILQSQISQFKMLINVHFDARQRPEAPECWRHLSVSGWPEVCRARIKKHVNKCREQRIIPELNGIIFITSWILYNHISLSQKEPYLRKMVKNGSEINAEEKL